MPELTVATPTPNANAFHAQAMTNGAAMPNGEAPIPFSSDQYETLQTLANEQGISLSDAVDQAIKIAKIIVGAHRSPGKRILIQNGKQVQELTLR